MTEQKSPEQGLETLAGQIERVTYANEENGFAVVRVRARGDRAMGGLVTVVGAMPEPRPGQELQAQGVWREDPRYGEQFQAKTCTLGLPATSKGVRMYLRSSMVKGVGEKYADAIVDQFGDDTLDILDKEPDRLLEVAGIGKKRLELIKQSWAAHQDIRELMIFLQSHGIGAGHAVRIFRFYGAKALDVVQENPYRLALDMHGVGFITADAIARKLGFAKDCDMRAEAGAVYALSETAGQGHMYFPRLKLVERCTTLLEIGAEAVSEALDRLEAENKIKCKILPGGKDQAVCLKPLYRAEKSAAKRLLQLMRAPKSVKPMDAEKAIARVQREQNLELAPKQKEAVRLAAENKALVITGGPGTGKTTIIKAVLDVYAKAKARALLAAPTGRAAKRMAEATGREAKTLHRLLEFSPQEGRFCRDEDNPLACSLLIVDEMSMVDGVLLNQLLKAVPIGATVVLVGDVHQLPSVGPGNVLGDIIESNVVPVVELNEIFRQARESRIVVNAHSINQGFVPNLEAPEQGLSDFYFIERAEPEQVLDTIVLLVKERIPKRFGLDPMDQVQVLSPMHKGVVGAENLNRTLQQALNAKHAQTKPLVKGERRFLLGDKVMQIRNNYDKDIFNGDIGRVVEVLPEERTMTVCFDDRDVHLDSAELDEIVPAYAVSIHKSQGSEYPAVVIPVVTQHYVMLQRNLLYTAVTRGKKLVVLVGMKKALHIAVNNNRTSKRHTLLADRLAGDI